MYSRTTGCPYINIARRVFLMHDIAYREIMIDRDEVARQRVLDWTGFLAVPTIVLADPGSDLPYEEPGFLPRGASPRGVNRGSMITEANMMELRVWLAQHGLIDAAAAAS